MKDVAAAPTSRARLVVDWPALSAEFHADRTTREVNAALDAAGLADRTLAAHFDDLAAPARSVRPQPERVRSLHHLWRRAAEGPVGSTLLLAWALYAECQWAWELSSHPERIFFVIGDIETTWGLAASSPDLDPVERQLADLLVAHIEDLRHGIRMENGLNCSCPISTRRESAAVVDGSQRLLSRLDRIPAVGWDDAVAAIRRVLSVHEDYFSGVGSASQTFLDVIEGRTRDPDVARAAADALRDRARGEELAEDVYASELRSHVVALVCLAGRLERTPLATLRLPQVDVTYVFSFTLQPPASVARRRVTAAGAEDGLLHAFRERADALAADPAVAITRVEETDLSDIWTHGRSQVVTQGPRDALEYEAVSVLLPDVHGVDARGAPLPPLRAEVRLSALGNHHLRLTGRVRETDTEGRHHDAGFHALNQAIRRGSSFMGTEAYLMGGAPPAPDPAVERLAGRTGVRGDAPSRTLPALARSIVRQVPAWAAAAGLDAWEVYFDSAVDTHTIIRIGHAEVTDDGGLRTARREDVLGALGPLLAVPVERTAAGLEDWLRYEDLAPEAMPSFLGDFAPVSSVAVQNARTTCLYAPGQPDWSLLGTLEMVEFVVSVRALLRAWLREVDAAVDLARETLRDRLERRYRPARELQHRRLELAETANRMRRRRARLHAEELARSSGHRTIMDRMLTLSGADRLEGELDQRIEHLDTVLSQLSEDAHTIEDRRINLILFVVALFSLADLVGLLNDLVWSGDPPSVLRLVQLGVFAVLVVGLAVVGVRAYRR